MRVRSSQTLVLSPHGSELVAFNFLSKSVFCCTPETLRVLQWLDDWRGIDETMRFIPDTAWRGPDSARLRAENECLRACSIDSEPSYAGREERGLRRCSVPRASLS